ncbi:BTB/POZ domain-containing protein At1g21780-like [Pyrus x bretschneideri]|uniref:BTB/POZ domain-containing protein At1g21780-like n=1 Tax=Pyrus x bretschneideri TaxID=225117 RepID=UPI00202DC3F0|nr:BTB/POZ domain-containing protein At1g21780-like [Pyrus x bretschneideri]
MCFDMLNGLGSTSRSGRYRVNFGRGICSLKWFDRCYASWDGMQKDNWDVTINTADGSLRAHKAILSATSPVFQSMFSHDLKEKESSIIHIVDMSLESCMALLSYLYGTIKQEDFWKHRLALLGAANKYDIAYLKDACEESLLEDINSTNVLERLQDAWLYQLNKLKKGCLMYLFDFGKIYDVREEVSNFFRHADRELMTEMFQEVLTVWKPV